MLSRFLSTSENHCLIRKNVPQDFLSQPALPWQEHGLAKFKIAKRICSTDTNKTQILASDMMPIGSTKRIWIAFCRVVINNIDDCTLHCRCGLVFAGLVGAYKASNRWSASSCWNFFSILQNFQNIMILFSGGFHSWHLAQNNLTRCDCSRASYLPVRRISRWRKCR